MTDTVLITGARAPVAIDLSRAFLAAGYAPLLADSVRPWAALASKGRAGPIQRHPPPRYAFEAFCDWLAAFVRDYDPRLIVPTCEEVFYVSAAAERGGFSDRVFAPPMRVLDGLHSKIKFAERLVSLGLDGPRTWQISVHDDLDHLPLPPEQLVFKPDYSRFGTATLIQPSADAVRALPLGQGMHWAAQEFVAGEEICFWSAAVDGKILAHAAYRPVWRHGRSAAYAFEHVDCPAALEVARAIANADTITGHLSFDMIRTPDGRTVPIECNPRAVSGLHLFDAQAELARRVIGERTGTLRVAQRRHLSLAMAMLGLPTAVVRGQLGRFLRDWRASEDVLGRSGDWRPIAGALLDAGRFALNGLGRARSATAETTDDIEWNGEPLL